MTPQPNHTNRVGHNHKGETVLWCECDCKWKSRKRKPLNRVPNVVFTPFHCPKCNKKLSDYTIF